MERAYQLIGVDGLQIPLPLMQRYGLRPGAQVVLELGAEDIRVLPALADRSEIEGKALRYLLRNLGDAVTIKARQCEGAWRVTVFASGGLTPMGELVYGLLVISWKSTRLHWRQCVIAPLRLWEINRTRACRSSLQTKIF